MNITMKLNKMQQIVDRLSKVGSSSRGFILSFLNHATSVIREGFTDGVQQNQVHFSLLALLLGLFDTRVANIDFLTNDGEFLAQYRAVQDTYIVLADRLKLSHEINMSLADNFRQRHAAAVLVAEEVFRVPQAVAANAAPVQALDSGRPQTEAAARRPSSPVVRPFQAQAPVDNDAARRNYWIAQLELRFSSGVFPETKALYDEWKADEPNRQGLEKILSYLQLGLQGLISLAEDITRGVVKLGFLVIEGACALIDKLLGCFIKDCQFLQKTVHAVGLGVDDALGQQFYIIKHPLEAAKQTFDAFMSVVEYIRSTWNSEDGFIKTLIADATAKAAQAYNLAKNDPYEAIRRISCLATHITIAVLIGKYLPRAFNPGPTGLDTPTSSIVPPAVDMAAAPMTVPRGLMIGRMSTAGVPIAVAAPVAAGAGMAAPIAIAPVAAAVAAAPVAKLLDMAAAAAPAAALCADKAVAFVASTVAAAPVSVVGALATAQTLAAVSSANGSRSDETEIQSLLDMLDIFEFTDPDDAVAIEGLREGILQYDVIGKRLYINYIDRKLTNVNNDLALCDEDDDDDKQLVQELKATQAALMREKSRFQAPGPSTDFFAHNLSTLSPVSAEEDLSRLGLASRAA